MRDSVAGQGLAGLAEVLDRTEDGMTVIDVDRRLVYANPAGCRVLGRPLEQLLGSDLLDSFDPTDHARIVAQLPQHGGEATASFFCVLRDPDRGDRDVLCATFALATGRSDCVVILRDLSDPAVAARTATKVAATAQVLGIGTTEQILGGVARLAVEGTRAVACGIVVTGEDHKLAAAGGFGFPSTPKSRKAWTSGSVTLDDLPGADRLLNNQIVMLPDARAAYLASATLKDFGASLHGLDWRAVVYAPLSWEGEVFGVFAVHLPSSVAAPSAAELAFCAALADQAAVVVINARIGASRERSRIARELHDSVTQALFSMTMHTRAAQLSMTKAGLDASEPLGRSLTQLTELSKSALDEMKALIFELRPGALAEEGFVAALRKQAAALSAREPVTMTVDGPEQRLELPTAVEEHLYRIVSEALHNVVRHAHADHAALTVTADSDGLRLGLTDDGVGFEPANRRAAHLGLATMGQRADAIGAELTITSAPGSGTALQITLPFTHPSADETG